MKFIKKLIAARKEKKITRKIEKALGFKLTEWQKEYIFGRTDSKPTGRQQGKTTAYIVRRLIACDTPLEFFPYSNVGAAADEEHGRPYKLSYIIVLEDIHYKLKYAGVKVCDVWINNRRI